MESVLESTGADERLDHVDRAVRAFEEARRRGGEETLARVWQKEGTDSGGDLAVLAALVKSDLRHRFDRGESPSVNAYIGNFPELRSSDSQILSLIYEEFCLREERDESVSVESFCGRYPEWKDSLISQLEYHRLISHAAAGLGSSTPKFPKAGDSFGEFELISVLGTGGSSRVFLARDTSLGGREVVLKVAVDRGNEPMILGRLEHPHIVWVNSVAYQPETRLRGLSMPYHPGLPLDELIKRLDPTSLPSHARIFWETLVDNPSAALPAAVRSEPTPGSPRASSRVATTKQPEGDGWKGFPIRGSYADGVAWIGRILADALHHAHGKGTFHRDIKPGNVLMTLSQGPQLLDFNLAESPHSIERADDAIHGGTLPYMAPEQIRAFLDPSLWEGVGVGADIYSLGLVLRELLTGRLPDLPDERLPRSRSLTDFLARRASLDTSVRRFNPSVPFALEAIVARCLAFAPEARYADASDLAEDLDRYLLRQPLKYTRNPSRSECVGNWLRRNRRVVELGIAVGVGIGTVLETLPVDRTPSFVRAAYAYGRNHFDEAIAPLKRLTAAYPKSPLPELFLGLARDSSELDRRAAEASFRKALALPNADFTIVNWARSHTEISLVDRLDDFAAHSLEIAKRLPAERDSQVELARRACEISLAIQPDGGRAIHTLATVEESEGNLDLAYKIISPQLNALSPIDPPGKPRMRFSLLMSKGRIATRWADQRRQSASTDEARRAVARLLEEALIDLDTAERLKVGLPNEVAHLTLVRAIASIALAETDLELKEIDDARRRAETAEASLGMLAKLEAPYNDSQNLRPRLDRVWQRIHAEKPLQANAPKFSSPILVR